MKPLSLLSIVCCCLLLTTVKAQEINYNSIFGQWTYKSPKGKDKISYDFTPEKKFVAITEHKELELKSAGDFTLDKKGDIDRLVLNIHDEGVKTKTQLSYYFIKFSGTDTLKVQSVSDRQDHWRPETRKNTMVFVRKKEKEKEN
ncbi:MAG: hypothetical protein REI78_16400 [Pedobacter sp.]|nr:hypothetical protein [Pedobacter sp.]